MYIYCSRPASTGAATAAAPACADAGTGTSLGDTAAMSADGGCNLTPADPNFVGVSDSFSSLLLSPVSGTPPSLRPIQGWQKFQFQQQQCRRQEEQRAWRCRVRNV